jgi:hypothetical protein
LVAAAAVLLAAAQVALGALAAAVTGKVHKPAALEQRGKAILEALALVLTELLEEAEVRVL